MIAFDYRSYLRSISEGDSAGILMAILEHPPLGTILICDFNAGFKPPEMVKRRPVVVISPKIATRKGLCTVVALSTTDPDPVMPYHCRLDLAVALPPPWNRKSMWIKGDMINTVGFHRLDFASYGKNEAGKRMYYYDRVKADQLKDVQACILKSIGLLGLTKHL